METSYSGAASADLHDPSPPVALRLPVPGSLSSSDLDLEHIDILETLRSSRLVIDHPRPRPFFRARGTFTLKAKVK